MGFATPNLSVCLVSTLLVSFVVVLGLRLVRIGRRDPRLPPGPATIPVLGNAHLIPATGIALKFEEWAKKYGPIYSLRVFDSNIIVISDPRIVSQLLDKKGVIYSDRPDNVVAMHVTNGHHLSFEQQGPSWKLKRAVTVRQFSPQLLDSHHFRVQEAEAVIFMNNLLDDPDRVFEYARLYPVSVACSLVYGHRAKDLDSPWYKEFYHMMDMWGAVLEPGANPPIEELPLLWWLPGKWKSRMMETRSLRAKMWNGARQTVEQRRAKGDKRDCFIDEKLDEIDKNGWEAGWPLPEFAFNNLCGELIEAGADTTANQILTLIMALAKHPEVQRKARAEIDAICSPDKAPTFDDFDQLPYINCIVKEGLRWRPTARSALPHRVTKDDEYDGYLIPRGSTIFLAVWAMHQDEKLYPDHLKFRPERFANHPKLANEYAAASDYKNRDHYGYGAGRRICPGLHLAERNMWRIVAKLIWGFDILEPLDPVTGKLVPLDENAYSSSILVSPLPFKVRVVPRSERVLQSIKREKQSALDFLKQFDE
ncbi:putative cytochrome P450 oxidoreductase [Teratosphaeria nubilosa]|uniref:Putative cytochrome P450 oxidoreductase n=1 Tax=Teratosphaeria nubilosa TaxID=161662 RepID=A0A6G1LN05_9PEZI|nr:putative cytochrome P450 oxidoreductase [Teratosphaeria nubilosa]